MNGIKKLWNRNFSILWQGQLISDFGNAAFSVALGFWVLEMTKTAAMPDGDLVKMGAVMAAFSLPRVIIGPFAGALADRLSRKWIIVLSDLIRGLLYTAMGLTVFFQVFPLDAIFPLAVLVSLCDGFFGPAISAAVPDIVHVEQLTKANSARSVSTTISQLIGQSLGGVLYAWLGAAKLILINGVSFLYAAVTQLFMKIPPVARDMERKHILRDMADGVKYTFGNRGIRSLLIMCLVTNFFALIGITLMTPLFNNTPGFGKVNYGFVMGAMMAGAVIGMVVLSVLKIRPGQRSRIFSAALAVEAVVIIPIGLITNVAFLFPLAFVAGICNAIVNMMIQTIMQATVPAENRGKVFGILGTTAGALMPLAQAASGFIASAVGVRPAIVGAFAALLLGTLPLLLDRHFRAYINTDVATQQPAGVEAAAEPAADGVEVVAAAPAPEQI